MSTSGPCEGPFASIPCMQHLFARRSYYRQVLAGTCLSITYALAMAASAQTPERVMQAPGPPDIRALAIEFTYYERGREGWVRTESPKIGGMIVMRCSYEYSPAADARSWSVGFLDGDTVLDKMVGPGLLEPRVRRTTRTWYGRILHPGAAELGCAVDVDNELAESNEADNRATRTLDIPAAARTATRTAPAARPGRRFGTVTPREAALARGEDPKLDLRLVEWAGIKRADDPRAVRAATSVKTAAVGERLAVNCGYRVHMDAPNGETHRIAPWQIAVDRDGEALNGAAGRTDLVSVRGATTPGDVFERFTPTQAGIYRFRCRLDSAGAIAETDESNNVADFTVQVGTATARGATPVKPAIPPARGQPLLGFAMASGTHDFVMGPKEATVYKGNLNLRFKWQAPDPAGYEWRWQVSLWPFPGDSTVPPPALLREGTVPSNPENVFHVNLAGFPPLGQATMRSVPAAPPSKSRTLKKSPPGAGPKNTMTKSAPTAGSAGKPNVVDTPMDFHIRIVPYKSGKSAAAPSNAVVAHYKPGPDPAAVEASKAITAESSKKQKLAEMNAQSLVYKIDMLAFERPIFAHPSRYGCVVIVNNPHEGKPAHPMGGLKNGEELCPKKDPKTQDKGTWDDILEGIEGYGQAWNGISWFYEQAKDYAASLFAEVIVPCEMLEEIKEGAAATCEGIAKEVAGTAISVGLTAAGVPPTIPDLEGMSQLAKGEAVEAAVNYTCELIESANGECTPEMRDGLAAAYSKGLDQLQKDVKKQSKEPQCGNDQEVKEQGKVPLPCFSEFGIDVKPAPGSVETPPAVTVRVTRTKPDPTFATECGVGASLQVKNVIADFGPADAALWPAANAKLPPISGVGGSRVLKLNFGPRQPWFPLGKKGATAQWHQLLSGGTATLAVFGQGSADAQPPLPAGKVSVGCAVGPGPKTISIPKAFYDKSLPWKLN